MNINQLNSINKKQASIKLSNKITDALSNECNESKASYNEAINGLLNKVKSNESINGLLDKVKSNETANDLINQIKDLSDMDKEELLNLAKNKLVGLKDKVNTFSFLKNKQASIKQAGASSAIKNMWNATKAMPGKAWNKAKLNYQDTTAALLDNLGLSKKDKYGAGDLLRLAEKRIAAGMPVEQAALRVNKGNRNLTAGLLGLSGLSGITNIANANRISNRDKKIKELEDQIKNQPIPSSYLKAMLGSSK